MRRHAMTDGQWRRIEPLVPGREGDPGRTGADNRVFVDAVLWITTTGVPWRDLPPEFGKWNSVFQRFRRWCRKGVWQRIVEEINGDPDLEHLLIDSSVVRVHQHGAGAKGGSRGRRSAVPAAG